MKSIYVGAILALATFPRLMSAATIDAKTNIFVAGQDSTGINTMGGLFPTVSVPTGATRLFLSFADAFNNFTGPWGAYGDNTGSIGVTVNVQNPVQNVPDVGGTLMLLSLGLISLRFLEKSRARASRSRC